ncbi:MAG: GntR family transcriptional regulator [Bifidobacteriaceae bacterium]|nr:GntR family transcriptional regulator [Bifidobacteriaceae bacterium]
MPLDAFSYNKTHSLNAALHTPISQRSRCNETMDAIKTYIIRARLAPGDVLPTETQLCDVLGASRSSIREAIRKLEALNILHVEHGKGTFVGSFSLNPMVETLTMRSMLSIDDNYKDLRNVVELRKFLDLGYAEAICTSIQGTKQPELVALADRMEQLADQQETFLQEDIAFHTGLLKSINNPVAEQLVHGLWLVHMAVIPELDLRNIPALHQTAQAHRLMLETTINGDIDGYREAVLAHYAPLESILDQHFEVSNNADIDIAL